MKKLLATLLTTVALPATAADLTIEVLGTEAKGTVYVALYDKADTWMKKAAKGHSVTAESGKTVIVIKDLPEGEYALTLFHDLDGDRKMARNAMGMPTEPWGFSKDAMGNFGPPSFDDAKVTLPAAGLTIPVNLRS
jgi:uncharacterized protein (DUF2141 family)